jgi:alanine racemase
MDPRQLHPTWVEVDLSSIENNVRLVGRMSSAAVMAVVKADGYGHGALPVAQAALRAGATWCGVARLEEALELRRGGLQCPILVLGPFPPGRLAEALTESLSLTVFDPEQIAAAAAAGRELGREAALHLKVDTGMSRLGARPEDVFGLARLVADSEGARLEGLFTHFARADEPDPTPTGQQLAAFEQVVDGLQQSGLRPPLVHAANSAASLTRPDAHFDLLRLGIAMYGLHPSVHCRLPDGFRPALSWKAQLGQVKLLPPGRGVSYGHVYITQAVERIGTLPVGYGDGFRRIAGNQALVRGARVPVVGRVCMDQCMLQLDGVPEARAGEQVVLIGHQNGETMPAEELAERWGTINYEVTCGIGRRVPRLYL